MDTKTNIDEETGIHNDGSPLGNAPINTRVYIKQAVCPDKKCPVFGLFIKCYQEFHNVCVTYNDRLLEKATKNPERDSASNLVDVVVN